MAKLLQTDSALYTMVPVTGYEHLRSEYQAMFSADADDDPRTVLLLNCGVTEDIRAFLDLKKGARIYVIDAHRPIHLNNLVPENDQVMLFFDPVTEEAAGEAMPPIDVADLYSDSDTEDDDDDESETDDDGTDVEGEERAAVGSERRPRRGPGNPSTRGGHDEDSEEEGASDGASARGRHGSDVTPSAGESPSSRPDRDQHHPDAGPHPLPPPPGDHHDDDDDHADAPPPRGRRRRSRAHKRAVRMQAREERSLRRIDYYKRARYYGRSASEMCYELAESLRKDETSLLWLAVLGLSDQILHGRLSRESYATAYANLMARVRRSDNYDVREFRLSDGGPALPLSGGGRGGGGGGGGDAPSSSTSHVSRAFVRGKITEDEALRFHLHRHWTLYDAIMYSPFVAARLKTWSRAGAELVEQFLAKMGFPLREANKPYGSMDPARRKQLPELVDTWVSFFNLTDIKFDSFKLQYGYTDTLGATDCVAAITALAEEGDQPARQFWQAWEALSLGSPTGLIHRGLERSKVVQKAVIEQAGRAIQGRRMELYDGLACLNLSDGMPPRERRIFQHAPSLMRLAQFIQDANATHRLGQPFLRMVVVGPEDRTTGLCWVVGTTSPLLTRQDPGAASLGYYFAHALERLDSRAPKDSLHGAAVQIRAPDMTRFVDEVLDCVAGATLGVGLGGTP